jgi:hypothetical protein
MGGKEMISKNVITDLIIDVGEDTFFDSLVAVVKDREIYEWILGGQDVENKAYQAARDASACMALVAYHIKRCTQEGLKANLDNSETLREVNERRGT